MDQSRETTRQREARATAECGEQKKSRRTSESFFGERETFTIVEGHIQTSQSKNNDH